MTWESADPGVKGYFIKQGTKIENVKFLQAYLPSRWLEHPPQQHDGIRNLEDHQHLLVLSFSRYHFLKITLKCVTSSYFR